MRSIHFAEAALLLLLLPTAFAQFVSSLPSCVQDCINSSQDENCSITDIACLCRASSGNFLPDLITCMHANCDNQLDNNLLLTPLELACDLAGAPIPASAIKNAENLQSSLATQATMTMTETVTAGGSSATTTIVSGSGINYFGSSTVLTSTLTTTEQGGSTIYVLAPLTIWSTTTIPGSRSTATAPESTVTSFIPVVTISTNSDGSTFTTTRSGVVGIYTTTDSRGSTVVQKSTYIQLVSSSSSPTASRDSISSTTTRTTSIAAQETTTSESSSKTTTTWNPDATDSAPFKMQNSSRRISAGWWWALGTVVALFWTWG